MSDRKHENESGLIIDPTLLANIQAACRCYAAELKAATSAESRLSSEQEAERFAAAIAEMPARVRAFFEREESPCVPPRRQESEVQRFEREKRASFGGWCG